MRYFRYFALAILFSLACVANAQVAITGRITGVVTDVTGAFVEGASVEVTGPALMAPRSIKTKAGGVYLIEQLPPGAYEITCTQTGFQSLVEKGVALTAGFTATVNMALSPGNVSQVVEVQGTAPIVDVEGSSPPTTFDIDLLQNIPSGRDPWSTAAQVPGATTSTFDVAGNQSAQQSSMSVHGSKTSEAVYSFNGLNLDWPGGSGGSTAFYVDYDSFQETQIVTDAAPPEVSVGGVYINLVTKQGSNQFHGMAAGYYLTNATQATIKSTTFTSPTTGLATAVTNAGSPLIMARDLTLNGGGPIIRDRLWGFGAYRFYVVKDAQLASLDANGRPGTDPNHQSNGTIRLDYQASAKNHLNAQWLYNVQNRFYRRSTTYSFVDQQAAGRQIEPAWAGEAQWIATLTPSLLIDTRAGYMHLHEDQLNEPGVTPATMSVADVAYSTLKGVQQSYPLTRSGLFRMASSASYFRGGWAGSHNFKVGGEFAIASTNADTKAPQNINVFFNSTSGPVYSKAYQVKVYNTAIASKSIFHSYAFFLQDAWTVNRHLTITAGLRFDHFRTFNPAQISPAASGNFVDQVTGVPLFPNTCSAGRCFAQSIDFANFNTPVPRISISYDPNGKGNQVFRAGYNRFSISQGTTLASGANPNTASGNTYTWNDTNGDGIPQQSEYLASGNIVSTFGGINTSVDPNLSRPYSDQINAGYQRSLFKDISVGVSYYYRTTKNQVGRINTSQPTSDYTVQKTIVNPLKALYPNQSSIPATLTLFSIDPAISIKSGYLITNIPETNDNHYNAVEFTANRRFDKHWQALVGFTMQSQKGTYTAGTSDDFNDPNLEVNRHNGSIDQDAPYIGKVDVTYVFPFKISTSINYQHETGFPILPTYTVPSSVGLKQSESVKLATNGALRLGSVDDVNMRVSRPISLRDGKLNFEPMVDLNNLTNANPVIARTTTYGPNFLRQTNFLNPFVARFGLKMNW